MKVSIVIPAYNEEKCIAETLKTVLAQDYSDFEVIVVNNGSTDHTAEIAKTFPIRVVDETRKGTQWARERGRLEAKGEIIANLDADCLPDKHWLTKAVSFFNDPKVVAVSGSYDYYDAPSAFFRQFYLWFQQYPYRYCNNLLGFLGRGALMIAGQSLFRVDALQKIGGYDTSIVFYGDDTDMAKRMSAIGQVLFVKDLIVKSSARRFYKQGFLKTFGLYFYYFWKHTLFSDKKRIVNDSTYSKL